MELKIPYYIHKVGAGFPSPATDYIEDDVDLNNHLIKNWGVKSWDDWRLGSDVYERSSYKQIQRI